METKCHNQPTSWRKQLQMGLFFVGVLAFLGGCTNQLYSNVPARNFGIMADEGFDTRYRPASVKPTYSPVIRQLFSQEVGSYSDLKHPGMLALDLLYKKAGNSLAAQDLIRASHQEQGACNLLPIGTHVLWCKFYREVWLYLTSIPTTQREKMINTRRFLIVNVFLRYPDNSERAIPNSVYAEMNILHMHSGIQQYELGQEIPTSGGSSNGR